ncbi:sulfite oxidase, mitochondrial-like isoform X2 [Paramacrobiotus metropolitanus]|uniref:sulfite oxidase, mitochondrial-like isoform X2 n=1 Tax=Paramacrobiotus metropolitanus TaxID=2943436 RepID=UPI0024458A1A|nr:sulfite oxidase, mitochondrial-like isoform X2 [Paramacrobiotus metropolitanus]
MIFCILLFVFMGSVAADNSSLSYEQEPERSHRLIINQHEPFNAETGVDDLSKTFLTPSEIFYVRNHGPVPALQEPEHFNSTYMLQVNGIVESPFNISLGALQRFPEKVSMNATLMCAGNRRTEMSKIKTVKGVPWGPGAIGNAEWTGVPLWTLLSIAKADLDNPNLHVEFSGGDVFEGTTHYAQSIPIDRKGDVLVAWAMNGQPLTLDHGYPLRVVVPGFIGARSVKWLNRITVLDHESQNRYQQKDYKLFLPSVTWENVDPLWNITPALTQLSVQSAITEPADNSTIMHGSPYTIKGYAQSNGARITRVDVSLNNGITWQAADIVYQEKKGYDNRYWSWTIWALPVAEFPSPCVIVCRAWDTSANTQPEAAAHIWNLRGVMNNAWHRVHVHDDKHA